MNCCNCERPAIVFIADAETANETIGYCIEHALVKGLNVASLSLSTPYEELSEVAKRLGRIPFDLASLPSGAANPVYGRTDLKSVPLEEFIRLIGELPG